MPLQAVLQQLALTNLGYYFEGGNELDKREYRIENIGQIVPQPFFFTNLEYISVKFFERTFTDSFSGFLCCMSTNFNI